VTHVFGHAPELTIPGGGFPGPVHVELPTQFPSLPPISDPVFGGTGPGIDIGRPVTTSTPTTTPTDFPLDPYAGQTFTEAIVQNLGFGPIPDTPAQQAGLAAALQYVRDTPAGALRLPGAQQAFLNAVRAYEQSTAAPVTPTVTAAINPTGTGGLQVSGVFPTEEIVPNVGGFFSNIGTSLGESFGGLINDIFQTDQSWDQWGAGLGTIADILAVTGVIPGGATGHYPSDWPQPTGQPPWGGTPPFFPGPTTTQAPTLALPLTQQWPTQPQLPPRGIPMPHVPTSIPVAFPGGAPVQQAAFPMQITPGGGGGQIRPAAHCSTSLPSRVDIPTVDARGNTRYTTFKNMGRPLLWSGDLAASKRVRKVAAKARRAKGR